METERTNTKGPFTQRQNTNAGPYHNQNDLCALGCNRLLRRPVGMSAKPAGALLFFTSCTLTQTVYKKPPQHNLLWKQARTF